MKYLVTFDLKRRRQDMFQIAEDILNEQHGDLIVDEAMRQAILNRIRERIQGENLELERNYQEIREHLQANYVALECDLNTSYILETEETPDVFIPRIQISITQIFQTVDSVAVIPLPENENHYILTERD